MHLSMLEHQNPNFVLLTKRYFVIFTYYSFPKFLFDDNINEMEIPKVVYISQRPKPKLKRHTTNFLSKSPARASLALPMESYQLSTLKHMFMVN
jgi:hypothetical protein